MKDCDPMFSALSDLDNCASALEDVKNLLSIFLELLDNFGMQVDPQKPWIIEYLASRMPLLLSLDYTICEKLTATLGDMNQSVKAALDAYSAQENQ